jgi:DNA-binding LacI/PurR family transcriptional regulator
MKNNPTIRDVAKAAGVSIATVSRILNDKPDVSVETRQKVLQTVEEIGYAKRTQWQQITSGKSRVISLHYPRKAAVQNQVSHDFIIGASAACEKQGYSLHIITQSLNEQKLLDLYRTSQSDGVILMEIRIEDWRVELLRQHQLPFVMIGHCEDNEGVSFIDLDFETAVIVAFDHLISLGHRQIGYMPIAVDPGRERYAPTVRAAAGYQKVRQKYGLTQHLIDTGSDHTSIKNATIKLFDQNPQITAIVSLSDITVTGIFDAIHSKGLRIPVDISFVGLTNDQGAQMTMPFPTTIQFPSWQIGYEAGNVLIDKLENNPNAVVQNLLKPQLIVRDSSGPVRSIT